MAFHDELLGQDRPNRVRDVPRPPSGGYFASPADWRDEVLYFLLPDRFSDGAEDGRPLLDRSDRTAARPVPADSTTWRWDRWAQSGADRWQGGTIRGITSKLGYLASLGMTAIWVGPVFKQRGHLDTYHGYGIQDFLDVDPRFGTRKDLVDLVTAAHARGMRVILDVIFNHSGSNFDYRANGVRENRPGFRPWPGFYPDTAWRDRDDNLRDDVPGAEDGVWPTELQNGECYKRAGSGSLGDGALEDPRAEHKRTDFLSLRDFNLGPPRTGVTDPKTLDLLVRCYQYWIALTDCDGFRIDTLKHVSFEQGRNFCGALKEFAARLGKHDFFLVGEVAGGDFAQNRYLEALGMNLNAALDIGEMRLTLNGVAKGLIHPGEYFKGFEAGAAVLGSRRNLGRHQVSVLDDHDHVFGEKVRFSADASSDHQVAAGVALQFFTLGIPCVYYGTEQAFAGPEAGQRRFLPDWKGSDRYLREAMFGPSHPRKSGRAGIGGAGAADADEPGFGPFGTAGRHCFDPQFPTFRRVAAMAAARRRYRSLRVGRQYLRPTAFLGRVFAVHGPGEIVAWSRVLDDEEALCVLNPHGAHPRGADVIVDVELNPPGGALGVVVNTAEIAGLPASHPVGSTLAVQQAADGTAFVEVCDLAPSECLVLLNTTAQGLSESLRIDGQSIR